MNAQHRLADRQFMVQHVVSNIPFDGPTPAANEFAIQKAREGAWASLTDDGAFIQSEELRKKAEWTLLPTPPTASLQLRIVFTAEEYLDYGFEVLEHLHVFTAPDPETKADALKQLMIQIGVPDPKTETKLFWRDPESNDWQSAACTRGARFDREVRRLHPPEGEDEQPG